MTFVAHCLSCFWYYHHVSAGKKHDCSTLDARVKDWSSSWVEAYRCSDNNFPDVLSSNYLASLYWAFTTITTTGYGDITPKSESEVLYCCFAMFLGALMFGYVVGSMASLVG